MKTKLLTLLVALITTTSLWAYDFQSGDLYYNMTSDTTVEVTYLEEYSSENYAGLTTATIPETVTYNATTYSVTSIGDWAFSWCTSLTSITIPNSVTSIGELAFYGCSSLTSPVYNAHCFAYMPTTFEGAYTIPDGIKQIAGGAFHDCSSLTSITIPNSVTSIGDRAFSWCTSLTSVVWNAKHCADFTSAPFGDQTTSLVFGDSVEHIPTYLGYGMNKLTSITIPEGVTSIGYYAFYGCSSLTSITIGNSVTSIGMEAFERTNLTSYICYNPSLTSFGMSLSAQPLLDTIVAPAAFFDVEEAGWASAPKHVRYARVIAGELTENAFGVINRSYKTLKVLDLESATNTIIADEAFKGCYNLDSLYLPSNLTYISYMAIADCKSLKSITIPATVEEIDNSAFENCRSLNSIIFEGAEPAQGPARHAANATSLWRIGSWAFYNCHQLQNLTIPEGVTEVGDAAFYGCTYLEDMVLPSTIQEIGDNGFALCAKLKKMHVKATTPPTIYSKTFEGVDRAMPVYVPNESVDAYKEALYWKELNIQALTAVDNIPTNKDLAHKFLYNGQLLILRDGKTYNVMGAEVK